MLKVLKQAITENPGGCKVIVTFHDNEQIEDATCVDADELGIVINAVSGKYLRMIPWTAIGVLDVQY